MLEKAANCINTSCIYFYFFYRCIALPAVRFLRTSYWDIQGGSKTASARKLLLRLQSSIKIENREENRKNKLFFLCFFFFFCPACIHVAVSKTTSCLQLALL